MFEHAEIFFHNHSENKHHDICYGCTLPVLVTLNGVRVSGILNSGQFSLFQMQ